MILGAILHEILLLESMEVRKLTVNCFIYLL